MHSNYKLWYRIINGIESIMIKIKILNLFDGLY